MTPTDSGRPPPRPLAPDSDAPAGAAWGSRHSIPLSAAPAATTAAPSTIPQAAVPHALAGPEHCLDGQLAGRLTKYFRCSFADLPEGFHAALRLWQWEHLRLTAMRCAGQTLHYKSRLDHEQLAKSIQDIARRAGLPFSEPPGPIGSPAPVRRTAANLPLAESALFATAELLGLLPFTRPEDLAAGTDTFLAVPHGDVAGLISLSTSGTTGTGKRVFCTAEDLEETAAFFKHGMRYLVAPGQGDSVALLMSGDRPGSVGDLLVRGMRGLSVPCSVPGFVRPGPEGEDAMLDQLLALAPTCLVGVPAQLLALARHRRAGELAGHVRSVLLSGDSVTPALRRAIAEGLSCAVFIHYGLTETGLGGAVECRQRNGCHMREADLLCEILDEDGAPVPRGAWGEIVLTTLTRQAMPLLRYRTGDEGRVLPAPCVCASVFDRLEIRGRMSQSLRLPSGRRLHMTELDARLHALPFVRGYAAVFHRWRENGTPRTCLRLSLRITGPEGEQALPLAARALSDLPELAPASERVSTRAETWAESAGAAGTRSGLFPLPVLLRIAREEEPGAMHPQAKLCLQYSDTPPPWR